MSSSPEFVVGCLSWGEKWNAENVQRLLERLDAAGIKHFDTASYYPPTNLGASEKLLGTVKRPGFTIDTKILLRPEALRKDLMEGSLRQSLESLGLTKVKTLYAHAPDKITSIADQAANFNHFYEAGYFEQLGLCNYSPEQLSEFIEIAKAKGYILPAIYQGQYNLFCRQYETDLFPLLRENGIQFVANSPLAGGFVTGKISGDQDAEKLKGTRFEQSETNMLGFLYRMWYDKPVFQAAMDELKAAVAQYQGEATSSALAQAAFRWLLFHSGLRSTDQVAIGPNSVQQLNDYLDARDAGPLSEELAKTIDNLYQPLREQAAPLVQVGWWS
ncbi:Aldo/keto reductase [Penicillium malachiteum]|uniref:Aldo/keto reductase n=1 Tax=Penicillium malachiteum TaxID=1324776 RepID=UPI002546932A|nr:Aldo/keto reductase [Penicillium malachiteum]KAJ5729645.1 Aldo/keto reductase [Penicillium malachiteum]